MNNDDAKTVRRLGLTVLDDGNGISEEAWDALADLLALANCHDIIEHVNATEGRYYIGEDFAEEELLKLEGWNQTPVIEGVIKDALEKQGGREIERAGELGVDLDQLSNPEGGGNENRTE